MDQNHVCRSRTLKQAYCNTDLLATKSSQEPGRPHHQTLHTRRGPSNWMSATISFQKYASAGRLTEAEVPDIFVLSNHQRSHEQCHWENIGSLGDSIRF